MRDCLTPVPSMAVAGRRRRPRFNNNTAEGNGGAMFAAHPESISLVCQDSTATANSLDAAAPLAPSRWNESYLGEQAATAMRTGGLSLVAQRSAAGWRGRGAAGC